MLGITVYRDVMSIVKMILFSPEKLKLRNIWSAWLLSLIYEGSDLPMGVMTLSLERLESLVLQLDFSLCYFIKVTLGKKLFCSFKRKGLSHLLRFPLD